MKVIFIGDIFGSPGREAVRQFLPALRETYEADVVIANGENSAAGRGLHPKHVEELKSYGVDFFTTGNHVFDAKEIVPLLGDPKCGILRPLNYPKRSPGRGHFLGTDRRGVPFLLVNLMGRLFMDPVNCPFEALDDLLAEKKRETPIVIVDFHAEATSEKRAFGFYFAKRISAVFGTHTHVQTADEEILEGHTAYISDVGMTGPYHSAIGMDLGEVMKKFTIKFSKRFEPATEDIRFSAVYVEIDDQTGKALRIERIQKS